MCYISNYSLKYYISIFLFSLCVCSPFTLPAQNLEADSLALVAFYNNCNGSNWSQSWNLNSPISSWSGVSVNNGRVTSLSKSYNNIVGYLPQEMTNLTALTYLNLNQNSIYNPASNVIGAMIALETYYIENNSVSFSISFEFCQNPTLEDLYMQNSPISGGIPTSIADLPNLRNLDLSSCNLWGTTIPQLFPSTLYTLDVQDNGLSGNITNLFTNNFNLTSIDFSNNNFTGNFPSALLNSPYLGFLDLSSNSLSGSLPNNIGDWQNMTTFIISENNFSGDLPSAINDLIDLDAFLIQNNSFSGSLPTSTGFYSEIEQFDIENNNFSGSIPTAISFVGGGFISLGSSINLRGNNLSGDLPIELFDNSDLNVLDISENNFTGTIDPTLVNSLNELEILDISDNNFSGQFQALNISTLRTLDISNNQFDGPFPNLSGLPELRNSKWHIISMSGTSTRFYNYELFRESKFCPGNNFTTSPVFISNPDMDESNLDLSCFAGLPTDNDNDGFYPPNDCNDNDASINPDAMDIINNNVDENCDGIVLMDADGDGFDSIEDCDDSCAFCYPGALEIPNNGIDEDCNGEDSTVCSAVLPPLPNNTVLCSGNNAILDAGQGYQNYLWSTGETTQTISVAEIGTYTVYVTDTTGCFAQTSTSLFLDELPQFAPNLYIQAQTACEGNTQIQMNGFENDTFPEWIISEYDNPADIGIYDMDLDGDMDILVPYNNNDNDIILYLNNGNQNFSEMVLVSGTSNITNMEVLDFEGDGNLDFIISDGPQLILYLNDGNLNFSPVVVSAMVSGLRFISPSDVDGDGDMDVLSTSVAFPNLSEVAWFENDGSLVFTKHVITTNSNFPYEIHGGDLDGDGDLDVLTTESQGNLMAWYQNDGNQNFTKIIINAISTGFSFARPYDIDEDGDLDIIGDNNNNTISLYKNDGSGNFSENLISNDIYGISDLRILDFDNDGDMDIISSAFSSNAISVHVNLGDETFITHILKDNIESPTHIFGEDIDSDGDIDIATISWMEDITLWLEQVSWAVPPLSLEYTINSGDVQNITGIYPNGSFATVEIPNLTIGTYSLDIINVTDVHGCNASLNLSTTINIDNIDVTCTENTPESGLGYNNGTASIIISNGQAPYMLEWSAPSPNQQSAIDGENIIQGLASGSYEITISDSNGCFTTCNFTINQGDCALFDTYINGDTIICQGGNTILTASTSINIPTYSWSTGESTSSIQINNADIYTVTATDGNGCTNSISQIITASPFAISCSVIFNESELGTSDGLAEIIFSSGMAPYEIQWNNNSGDNGNLVSNTDIFQMSGLNQGNYLIIATDAIGCSKICNFSIGLGIEEFIINDGTTYSTCSGTLYDSGGPNSYYDNDEDMTIEICPSNNFACLELDFISFWSEGLPYDYLTIEGISSGNTIATLEGELEPTTFHVSECVRLIWISDYSVIRDGWELNWSCSSSLCPGSSIDPIIIGENIICSGDTTILDAGLGYDSYNWSTGENTQTIEVSTSGTYTVTVTSGANTGNSDFILAVNPSPTPIIIGNEWVCEGESNTLNAGIFDTYIWSNGETTPTINTISSGIYSVTVTETNGCSGVDEFSFSVEPNPTPNIIGDSIACDEAILDAGIHSSYSWSNGEMNQTINATSSGIYTITVMDDNGCSGIDEFHIQILDSPQPSIIGDSIICHNQSLIINAGEYISYSWSTGEFTQNIEVNTGGTYTVTVVDENNCEGIDEINIFESNLQFTCTEGLPSSGSGVNDGSIDVSINGGIPPYSISWTGTSSGNIIVNDLNTSINNLAEGDYEITIADSLECSLIVSCSVITTSIFELLPTLLEYTLSPNPASSILNIKLALNEETIETNITIRDILGREVYSNKFINSLTIDSFIELNDFSEGTYFISFEIDNKIFTDRFVVAKK